MGLEFIYLLIRMGDNSVILCDGLHSMIMEETRNKTDALTYVLSRLVVFIDTEPMGHKEY